MDHTEPIHADPAAVRVGPSSLDRDERIERLAVLFSPRGRRRLPVSTGNDVRLLINGNEVFPAMLAAILTGRRTIEIEMYIWRADVIGRRFADLLCAKAAEGVRVRVIHDGFGCWQEPQSFWARMREAGIEVAVFNPLARWRRSKAAQWFLGRRTANHRDHRKLLIVDGEVAFIGGVNIGDEYVGQGQGLRHWRDTAVRVRGPVLQRFVALFDRQWRRVTGLPPLDTTVRRPAPAGDLAAILLDSRPWRPNNIHRTMLTAIKRARRQIEITMAYFVPPPRFIRALRRAAGRGVDVRLILPGHSDVRAVFYAGRSQYDRLLRVGVRIYECQGTVLHAKTVQIDGVWATVGSANLDQRSFLLNDEVNLFVLGRRFADELHRAFVADLSRSREIELKPWRARPWLDRLRERMYRLLRPWL